VYSCRDAFHVVLCITLRNGLKMREYKVYWLTDFPLIANLLGARQEIIMVISQEKQTNKHKEKLIILQSIGMIVIIVKKKGDHLHPRA